MNQQPDKLFRDKLEGYSRPASADAWDKIESNLDRKSTKGLWFKIAASLTLILIAGYILWLALPSHTIKQPLAIQKEKRTKNISAKEIEKKSDKNIANSSPTALPKIKTEKTQASENRVEDKFKNQSDSNQKKPHQVRRDNQSDTYNAPTKNDAPISSFTKSEFAEISLIETQVNGKANETPLNEEVLVVAQVIDEGSIKIIYTAAVVDEKYLDKKSLAQATSDEKKSSTFKKLLSKAYDLKNNQDPFGDLRQKKNEILALNFKKEKRGQNK